MKEHEQKAREIARRPNSSWDQVETEITAALLEAEQRGRKAMEKWCQHRYDCAMMDIVDVTPRCTCGLDEARAVDGKGGE